MTVATWLAVAVLASTAAAEPIVVRVDATLERVTVTDCPSPCRPATWELEADGERVIASGTDRLLHAAPWLARLRRPVDVHFEVPAGVAVSSPGMPLDARPTRFRLAGHPGGWPGVIAFGRFQTRSVEVGTARFDVTVLDGAPRPDVEKLTHWVVDAACRVLLVYGDYPVPRVQVVVAPVEGRPARRRPEVPDPVPFGRVLRDGGEGVQLFVRQSTSAAELARDWTATHEFSHLLLPYVDRRDGWLPEGFATYYQNVLLVRAGVYDPRTGWQRLVDGFGRGRRDGYRDTLAESIAREGENHVMRMYWSGAAIALMADVELRREGTSLDAALAGLRSALPSDAPWRAAEVTRSLDAAAGSGALERLRRRWIHARAFPDVEPLLEGLGVRHRDGRVVLDDAAPLAGVRRAIMTTRLEEERR